MSQLNIPKMFTLGEAVLAEDFNNNFDAVADLINGGIDDSNIKSLEEATIEFTPATGHDHSEGNGAEIYSATDTVHGGLKMQTGSIVVAGNSESELISFDEAFSVGFPFILIKSTYAGTSEGYAFPSNEAPGFPGFSYLLPYAQKITPTGFTFYNPNALAATIIYCAIGK